MADPSSTDPEARTGAQAVERALAVLAAFVEHPGERDQLGITEIAKLTDLRVSTAHRIVKALVRGGLVEQDPWTERYRLGRGSVLLGQVATRQLGLPGVLDELRRLVDATGESASLGFREGSEVVVLLRVESPHPLRFDRPPGSRERLHASAMGKVLLAWAGDPAGEIAVMPPLPSFTARTITKRAALTAEVAQIKARGWALNDEERHLGVRAVAAPVFQTGLVRASVAVQGPSNRLTDDRLDDLAATVRDAALAIAPQLNL